MDTGQELQRIADVYRGQGYDVVVHPGPDQLPGFAKDFRIEILGRRGAESVLVAVRKNRNEFAADQGMQRYAEVTGSQPGWRFDFAILEAENPHAREVPGAREFTRDDIAHSLEAAAELSRGGFTRYAVIPAWAALEAAMRLRLHSLAPGAEWGGKTREMVKELYSAGALSPDEYRRVQVASQIRNQLVHGFAPQTAGTGDSERELVRLLGDIAGRLVGESPLAHLPA